MPWRGAAGGLAGVILRRGVGIAIGRPRLRLALSSKIDEHSNEKGDEAGETHGASRTSSTAVRGASMRLAWHHQSLTCKRRGTYTDARQDADLFHQFNAALSKY